MSASSGSTWSGSVRVQEGLCFCHSSWLLWFWIFVLALRLRPSAVLGLTSCLLPILGEIFTDLQVFSAELSGTWCLFSFERNVLWFISFAAISAVHETFWIYGWRLAFLICCQSFSAIFCNLFFCCHCSPIFCKFLQFQVCRRLFSATFCKFLQFWFCCQLLSAIFSKCAQFQKIMPTKNEPLGD